MAPGGHDATRLIDARAGLTGGGASLTGGLVNLTADPARTPDADAAGRADAPAVPMATSVMTAPATIVTRQRRARPLRPILNMLRPSESLAPPT